MSSKKSNVFRGTKDGVSAPKPKTASPKKVDKAKPPTVKQLQQELAASKAAHDKAAQENVRLVGEKSELEQRISTATLDKDSLKAKIKELEDAPPKIKYKVPQAGKGTFWDRVHFLFTGVWDGDYVDQDRPY